MLRSQSVLPPSSQSSSSKCGFDGRQRGKILVERAARVPEDFNHTLVGELVGASCQNKLHLLHGHPHRHQHLQRVVSEEGV
jgi:hypothetical protein